MKGYKIDIEKTALANENFRKVLYTSNHLQLVVMSLQPGEEIGLETHYDNDQFFRLEQGKAVCIVDDMQYEAEAGDVIIIPAGAKHNIINKDQSSELKLYTIYTPPHHKDGTVHKTKAEAKNSKEEFDGNTTEPSATMFAE